MWRCKFRDVQTMSHWGILNGHFELIHDCKLYLALPIPVKLTMQFEG